jgi:hypothetical protein
MMDRRAFLNAMSGSLLAAPLAAEGQTPAKVYRIGYLSTGPTATPHLHELECRRKSRLIGSSPCKWCGPPI